MKIWNKLTKLGKKSLVEHERHHNVGLGITEKFCSLQGEGDEIGVPSIFIRIGGCTLQCPWCDTKYSSRDSFNAKYMITDEKSANAFVDLAATAPKDEVPVKHAVFTGGEPLMLPHLNTVAAMVRRLWNVYGINTTFETTLCMMKMDIVNPNATALDTVLDIHDTIFTTEEIGVKEPFFHFAVSPKLQPNCYKVPVTKKDIIRYYTWVGWLDNKGSEMFPDEYFNELITYKFVYHPQTEDTLLKIVNEKFPAIVRKKTCIMPYTPMNAKEMGSMKFDEAYKKSCLKTADFCKCNNLRYSPREHINLWGLKRGI